MPYLSYSEYQDLGGTLSSSDFALAEFAARKKLDFITDSRIQNMSNIPKEVKLAIMALIKVDERTGANALAENPLIASFNTDGYSESYGNPESQIAILESQAMKKVRTLLWGVFDDDGVPLLYRGVYPFRETQ